MNYPEPDYKALCVLFVQQRDKAQDALLRAGWTLAPGAAAWKPPLGDPDKTCEILDLKDKLAHVTKERDEARKQYFALENRVLPRSPLTPEGEDKPLAYKPDRLVVKMVAHRPLKKGEKVGADYSKLTSYGLAGQTTDFHPPHDPLEGYLELFADEDVMDAGCVARFKMRTVLGKLTPEDPRSALYGEMLGALQSATREPSALNIITSRVYFKGLIQRAEKAMEGNDHE